MKKIITSFCTISICFFIFSCKEPLISKLNYNTDLENQVSKEYYSKDVSKSFSDFLKNPEEITRNYRNALIENEERELTEEEMFAGLWDSLTEEEKQTVIENSDSVELSLNGIVAVDETSSVGRAALTGNFSGLDNIASMYGFMQKLNEWFKDYTISQNLLPECLRFDMTENVPLVQVIEYCVQNELWSDIEQILSNIDTNITSEQLKKEYELFNYSSNKLKSSNRASILVGYEDEELAKDFGDDLYDGSVILTSPKEKAFLIAGNLVSPDDLYGSGFDVYRTITIRFLWWSKSWTKKIYSGTSFILTELSQ